MEEGGCEKRMKVDLKTMLRPDEVATALRVSRSTVYLLCQTRDLKSCKVGRLIRIPKESLSEYIRKSFGST